MSFLNCFSAGAARVLWCCAVGAAACSAPGVAQQQAAVSSFAAPDPRAVASSREVPSKRSGVVAPTKGEQHVDLYEGPVRPFSSVAVEVEAGTLGIGAEIATPLSRSFNVRGGAEFLNFGDDFTVDAAQYQSEAHLRSGHVAVDFHPMGAGFRISPQLLIFGSAFSASVSVAGGQAFELGNSSYLSSATDPVHGGASITMGRHIMPALTMGWGNMLARHGHHWSIPIEIGVAYTGHYTLNLNLSGTACLNYLYCMSTSSPQVQQSMRQEEADLNETMKHFQIYPIVKTGFGWRF